MAQEKSNEEFNPVVVVAIDVGTARSGYSYAFVKEPKEIVCEQSADSNVKQLTAVLLRADLSFVALYRFSIIMRTA
jgi:hypothetical protein